MKITLSLMARNEGPFNCAPAREVELNDTDILANDVTLPWEFNPHNTGLFVVGNEFGALLAIWGAEHEVLDIAVDEGRLDSFAAEDPHTEECKAKNWECNCEEENDLTRLGNASELFDIVNCWIQRVDLSKCDVRTLCLFAEARGQGADNLGL